MFSIASDRDRTLLAGYALVVYGIVKITLCLIVLFIPHSRREKVPFLKWLSPDATLSGHVIEVILFVFGCYTLLHGLSLLEHIGPSYARYIDHVNALIAVYGGLGIFMIVFFSLVAYTDIPIPKDKKETPTYEIVGIGGGIMFLVSLCAILLYGIFYHPRWMGSVRWPHDIQAYVIASGVMLVALAFVVIHAMRNKVDKNIRDEVVTLMMLPLGTVN